MLPTIKEGEVSFVEVTLYCHLIEKEVRLKAKPVGRCLLLEECSEADCPMKRSVNCIVFKVLPAEIQ